jgi:hypothetical protein
MSDASTRATHPAPHRDRANFLWLLFGCSAAPIFWLGQLMLGYWVSAQACYSGDHPVDLASVGTLRTALIVFDIVAMIATFSGAVVSWSNWRATQNEKKGGATRAIHTGEGRTRFLALWGLMSSLWFFGAIVFNTIGSIMVPLCVH